MANEDGVWRTVGGRRIFIKKGQNLSDAMKDSGKFGSSTKKKALGKSLNDIEQENADGEGLKKLLGKDREEQAKINQDYIKEQSKLAKEKENRNTAERKKALDELREYSGMDADNAETYNAPLEEIKGRTEQLKKDFEKQEKKKALGKGLNDLNKEELDDETANKLFKKDDKKAKESEKTTDEDKRYNTNNETKRLEQAQKEAQAKYDHAQDKYEHYKFDDSEDAKKYREEYNREKDELTKADREYMEKLAKNYQEEYAKQQKASNKTYKVSELEKGKPYEIDMGYGIKKTAIFMGKDEDGNNAFYDGEGVAGTFAFSDKFMNESIKVSDNKDDDKFIELHNQLNKGANNNDWVKKAFQEYKKEHKNTKLTLDDFRKKQK